MLVFLSMANEMTVKNPDRFKTAKKVFRDRGGVLKTGDALSAGIHPRTLYEMERSGILEKLARGLYSDWRKGLGKR